MLRAANSDLKAPASKIYWGRPLCSLSTLQTTRGGRVVDVLIYAGQPGHGGNLAKSGHSATRNFLIDVHKVSPNLAAASIHGKI